MWTLLLSKPQMLLPKKTERIKYGSATLIVYDFAEPTECIPMHNHAHDVDTNHISIVVKGSFICKGSGWQMTVKAGDIVSFEADQWHEFIAVEKDSKLINVNTGPIGTPEREVVTNLQHNLA